MQLIWFVNYLVAGFEDANPCDKFLVKSNAQAPSRIPRRPAVKTRESEPTILGTVIIGLFYKHSDGCSENLLYVKFVCMRVLAYTVFSVFLSFYY